MIINHIKSALQQGRKLILLVLVLVVGFAFSVVTSAQNNQFQLAPKEKLAKFYEAQFKRFYDSIPTDVSQKHAVTIAKIDQKIEDENIAGAITSKISNFDLDYYNHVVKIGILPYIDKNDSFGKDVVELINDIDKYTIDYPRLEEFNKVKFGNDMPLPTTFVESTAVEDNVRISLNGSGYNVTNAVNYARAWTQNGTELRNQNYNYYNGMNDCTNFVSQVLHDANAGTIPYIRNDNWGWDYDDPDNWYYVNGYLDPPSWTWGGAHNQYVHLQNWSSNVRRLYYWSDVRVGDVVMWDTTPGDGVFNIGHNSVVTKIQGGIIYLTYHSTDREDEPISTLLNAGYLGYAWAINH
jgi:hypothetical protein